jgi:hypothetical protein
MLSQLSYIPTLYHQHRPAYFGPAVSSDGGERGIRTLGAETRSTVFETVPFDHSGISPSGTIYNQRPDINSGEPYCLLFIRISPAEAPPDDSGKLLIAAERLPGRIIRLDIKMAEREGFEPSVESPPHTISNRAD